MMKRSRYSIFVAVIAVSFLWLLQLYTLFSDTLSVKFDENSHEIDLYHVSIFSCPLMEVTVVCFFFFSYNKEQ